MAVNSAAKAAMQKGRVEKAKSKKDKKVAAQARAAVARYVKFFFLYVFCLIQLLDSRRN